MIQTFDKEVMIIAEKDSFLIRALEKKLKDEGLESFFCPEDIDAINKNFLRAGAVVYYINTGETKDLELLHILDEHLFSSCIKVALVGDKDDIESIRSSLNSLLVMGSFERPLDTEALVGVLKASMAGEGPDKRKSIMIVDDDMTYLGLVRDWLKDSYKVYMANSGLQAIKALGKNRVDLILLDYEMPVTSGPQVLEMLRSDVDTSDIPVMFLTGKNDRESVMHVLELKPEGYFLKTIEKNELLLKLNDFFIQRNS